MNQKLENKISEKKIEEVKELSNLLNKKTILVVSIKNLPASQFQEISKKLRGKAVVKVPKKNLIYRAIDESEKEGLKNLKEKIEDSSALLFSDEDSFDLASELLDNKRPAKAKAGQIAPEDIEVSEGPTDLISGPVISDFGTLGIPIQIDKGKITIKEAKVIVKEGKKISESAAGMMDKLDIKPFYVGFVPVAAYDTKENKLYLEISINKEEAAEDLKNSFSRALAFAVEIGYPSNETIKFMISKAAINEKALSNFVENKTSEDSKEEEKVEKSENTEEKVEEEKPEKITEDNVQTSEEKSEEEN